MFYLVITIIQIVAELADVMLLSPDLRAAEKDLKELVADYHFLQEHGIHTVADLQQILSDPSLTFCFGAMTQRAQQPHPLIQGRKKNKPFTKSAERWYPSDETHKRASAAVQSGF